MYYSRPQMAVEQDVQEPLHEPDQEHALPVRGGSHEDVCVVGGVGLIHGGGCRAPCREDRIIWEILNILNVSQEIARVREKGRVIFGNLLYLMLKEL